MTSAVEGDYHYIQAGDGREELFDLRRDPAETATTWPARPDLAAVLDEFRAGLRR